jgi:hypothetical protein
LNGNKKMIKLIRILKKLTDSVRFRFYKLEIKKPNPFEITKKKKHPKKQYSFLF